MSGETLLKRRDSEISAWDGFQIKENLSSQASTACSLPQVTQDVCIAI